MTVHRVPVQFALSAQRHHRVPHVRRLDVAPVQVRGVTPDGKVECRCEALPERRERRVEAANRLAFGSKRPRPGDDPNHGMRNRRHQAIERRRPVRQTDRPPCQRLDQARQRVGRRPVEPVEHAPGIAGRSQCQDGAAVAVPRADERFIDPLAVALGRDQRPGAPCPFDFKALQRDTDRERRVLTDDGWTFASHPDAGLAARVVRITAMLPVPPKPVGFSRVGTVGAAVEQIDAAAIVGLETIDL